MNYSIGALALVVAIVSGCSSGGARKSKMSAQFKKIKQDVVVMETTPEPKVEAPKPETEVLRILAENNFDSEKAVQESEKQGIAVEAPPEIAKMVTEIEKKVEVAEAVERGDIAPAQAEAVLAKVESGEDVKVAEAIAQVTENSMDASNQTSSGRMAASVDYPNRVCEPWHPALKRIRSHRMKVSTFEADRDKYHAQIMRSYKDMGGIELREEIVADGMTLQKLSLRTFGTNLRWPEIYLLNKDVIANYDTIIVGLAVKTPVIDWSNEKHCEPTHVGGL